MNRWASGPTKGNRFLTMHLHEERFTPSGFNRRPNGKRSKFVTVELSRCPSNLVSFNATLPNSKISTLSKRHRKVRKSSHVRDKNRAQDGKVVLTIT